MRQFLRLQVAADNVRNGLVGVTREHLIKELREGKNVDILGFVLSPKCFAELAELDLPTQVGLFAKPTLIVSIIRLKRERKDLESLVQVYRRQKTGVDLLYVNESTFWFDPNNVIRELTSWQGRDQLFGNTLAWLESSRP